MAHFMTKAELYRLLHRESPPDVYPDGEGSRYVSTAETDSVADACQKTYATMEQIYNNLFVVTSDERIADFEISYFGTISVGLTLEERRARILAKIRSQNDMSRWALLTQVAALVPGVIVNLIEGHTLDNLQSYDIRGTDADLVWGPDWTAGDPAPAGVTVTTELRNNEAALLAIRNIVYRYYVVIFSDALTQSTKDLLDETLTYGEPARSAHTFIYFNGTDVPLANTLGPIGQFDGYHAVRQDPTELVGLDIGWFGFDEDDTALTFGDVTDANVGGMMFPIYPGRI